MSDRPEIRQVPTQSGGFIEVCGNCSTPVPGAYSYQDASNQVWKKRACPTCNAIFSLEGPYKDHQSANPRVFK